MTLGWILATPDPALAIVFLIIGLPADPGTSCCSRSPAWRTQASCDMVWDGSLLRDLLVQTLVVALLIIFIFLDRRDHTRRIQEMRRENERLQQALIDHMNRLAE